MSRKSLYLEVVDALYGEISQGKYPPGAKLPSEEKLATQFQVSRVTLREALRALEKDGCIVRRQGQGTFVRDQKLAPVQNLSAILSISNMFRAVGLEDRFALVTIKKILASRRVAEKMRLQPNEPVWEVTRLRTIGETPAIYSQDYFPAAFLPVDQEEKLKAYEHNIYLFLVEVCGQTVEQGRCTLKPMISDDKLSPAMGVKRGTPLMYIETIDVNHDNQPVLYAREYYVAEHFEFLVLRRRNGGDSTVP